MARALNNGFSEIHPDRTRRRETALRKYTSSVERADKSSTTAWNCDAPKQKCGARSVTSEGQRASKTGGRKHLPPVDSPDAKVARDKLEEKGMG